MKELVDLAKELNESDEYMTNEQYRMFADQIQNFAEDDKKEIAHILLMELVCSTDKLTLSDFNAFKEILEPKRLENYICDAMEIAHNNYGKKPIFQNNELANAVSEMYRNIKRCEYLTVMAMLNNGFGDKNVLKSYLDSVERKVFNYSPKWKALYLKAKAYISI